MDRFAFDISPFDAFPSTGGYGTTPDLSGSVVLLDDLSGSIVTNSRTVVVNTFFPVGYFPRGYFPWGSRVTTVPDNSDLSGSVVLPDRDLSGSEVFNDVVEVS